MLHTPSVSPPQVARLEAEVESLRRQLDERRQADRAAAEQAAAREAALQDQLARAREAAVVVDGRATAAASEAQQYKVSDGSIGCAVSVCQAVQCPYVKLCSLHSSSCAVPVCQAAQCPYVKLCSVHRQC